MRSAGTDYIKLFRRFPLVVLRDEAEYQEAIQHRDWLRSRTELSRDALEYGEILDIIILDFEVKEADREMALSWPLVHVEPKPTIIAFPDEDTPEPEDSPIIRMGGGDGLIPPVDAARPARKRRNS